MLPGGVGGVVHGESGRADGDHGQGQQASDHASPPPAPAARGVTRGAKELRASGR